MNRRDVLAIGAMGAGTAAMHDVVRTGGTALRVDGLQVAQLSNPLGLGDERPSLSWRLDGAASGVRQTAFRIRVATSPEALKANRCDLWDSGKKTGSASTGTSYGGKPLRTGQRAWWDVTVWESGGARVASEPAWWEMGLLDSWRADWIAAESTIERDDRAAGTPFASAGMPEKDQVQLFRLPFDVDADGNGAITVYSTGVLLGLTLDGQPMELPFHPSISFGGPPATHITKRLSRGRHVIQAKIGRPDSYYLPKDVSIAAQVRLQDGTRISSGWETAAGRTPTAWSTAVPAAPQPYMPWPASPAVQMRRAFVLKAKPASARLYVTALGGYEMRLNGKKVGDHLLETETTDYRKTVLVRTFDVTDQLSMGENVLGAIVGDGWYASYAAPAGRYPYGPAPRRLLAQLEVRHVDGSTTTIGTNQDWALAPSPIVRSELYDGEDYDARLETIGWDAPGFDARNWTACWAAPAPTGELIPHAAHPIRVTRVLRPVKTTRLSDGRSVVDFGQNCAGFARLKARGQAGQSMTMQFAEVLKADGSVDQANLRAARATDTYTLRGDSGGETFVPRFTYHGFRYVEIAGPVQDWSIEALVIGSDLPETGTLRIDNPLIQKLWLNTLWSQRSNFMAVPTDCPQRDERLGWTGDAQVFWDAAAFNMDVGAFTSRFLRDLRDAQGANGAFPIFAPATVPTPGASPGWSDAGVMLPWTSWRRYGDLQAVRNHWPAMQAYVAGIVADNPDLIWKNVKGINFGDWLSLDAKSPYDETTPRPLVATAMLKRTLDQMGDMAEALGERAAAAQYRDQARKASAGFQAQFVRSDGQVGNGSHTSYILAIRLGLLKPEQQRAAGERLAADIRKRGKLLSTGFLGTPLSLDALADVGETSLVYDLLLRTEFPSWGYMVSRGATTIWERWNGDTGDVAMNSFNHYALGAVCGFLFRRVAGIEEIEPGFARFRVNPLVDPRVRSGGATYESVRGKIETAWTQQTGGLKLDVTVPPNTVAEVHLPGGSVTKDLKVSRAKILRQNSIEVVVEAESGRHSFG